MGLDIKLLTNGGYKPLNKKISGYFLKAGVTFFRI
jgi:hypothetical protein